LSIADLPLSAMSASSGIQKKFAATSPASAARSFLWAISPSRLRNVSKLGSFNGAGSVIATAL
jgi:hypothetical protein